MRGRMNSVHYSSKNTDWETPKELFSGLNNIFNFTLDPCASKENALLPHYLTKEMDGLKVSWKGHRVFCNPPYGRELGKWIKKAYEESAQCPIIVVLCPARTDTKYFHQYSIHSNIFFIEGRLKFSNSLSPAPFPSMLLIFNNEEITLDLGIKGTLMRKL